MSTQTIAIIVPAVVAMAALFFQWLFFRGQRKHEREMAREARTQERRAAVYEEVLKHIARQVTWFEDRLRMSIQLPTLEEMSDLFARVVTYASDEVDELFQDWFRAFHEFRKEKQKDSPRQTLLRDIEDRATSATKKLRDQIRKELSPKEAARGTLGTSSSRTSGP